MALPGDGDVCDSHVEAGLTGPQQGLMSMCVLGKQPTFSLFCCHACMFVCDFNIN